MTDNLHTGVSAEVNDIRSFMNTSVKVPPPVLVLTALVPPRIGVDQEIQLEVSSTSGEISSQLVGGGQRVDLVEVPWIQVQQTNFTSLAISLKPRGTEEGKEFSLEFEAEGSNPERVTFSVSPRAVEYIESPREESSNLLPLIMGVVACLSCSALVFTLLRGRSPDESTISTPQKPVQEVLYNHQDFIGYHGSKFELRIPILDLEYWETNAISLHMETMAQRRLRTPISEAGWLSHYFDGSRQFQGHAFLQASKSVQFPVEVEEHNKFLDFTTEKLVHLQHRAYQRGEPDLDLMG